MKLRSASCKSCSAVTSRSELEVLRKSFLMMRKFFKFRSRKQKWSNINETFAFLAFPIQEPPAHITKNESYTSGVNIGSIQFVALSRSGASIDNKHQVQINTHFERMLAKIALGFSVAKYGLPAFAKIYIRDIILGKADDSGRWVGTDELVKLPVELNAIHTAGVFEQSLEVTVRIRLFSMFKESPEYTVVVGVLKTDYLTLNENMGDQ
ncbi:hypothetical protein [Parachryseolinea silvisoli]|uniref:hypothetical protein n=1 Tax=Parachryseolinea silvisoli TaxID=2873601 RepID=UPI002265E7BA|nr:hypothetical protein [Parachryseolinea silvisoli]MCD9015211.1 hypothetical protein [Parachryseolinea silvisoli]